MTPVALTPQEVADALHVSVSTIHRRVESGEIPHLRLGKALRIPRAYVDNFARVGPSTPVVALSPTPCDGGRAS